MINFLNFSWQDMHNSLFFLEKKSEIWNAFTLFEKWKVNLFFLSLISRVKSEMKMPWNRDREWKVNWKCLEIEIEKWNFSRIFEKFREILENQEIKKISNFVTNAIHLANVYSGIQQNAISESICHMGFWGWSLVETCKAVWMDWVGNLWMHLCWRRTKMADIDSDLLTIKKTCWTIFCFDPEVGPMTKVFIGTAEQC